MTDTSTSDKANRTFRCSLIIPTRDKLEFLKPCIESVLASSNADEIEIIIVDNDSKEESTRNYLDMLATRDNCQILAWPRAFNYSAINNYAAEQAQSELLCLLNNDIEITDPDWLLKLCPLAEQENVGAVGCLLLYPTRKIQHAGVALDSASVAKHIALGEDEDFLSINGISQPYAVSAATAACLVLKRSLYQKLGGLNESHLAVAYNDVDLCLRLGEKAYPTLIHPGVSLVHHESVSRQSDALPANRVRAEKEYRYMLGRWHHRLQGQRYLEGLPAELLQADDDSDAAIKNLIDSAVDRLFHLPAADSDLSLEKEISHSSGHSDAQFWREHYQELEGRFEAMEAHAQRLEELHARILNSPVRKLTAPLRWLREKLRPQAQQVEESPVSRPTSGDAKTEHSNKEEDYKLAYRKSAETHLKLFLASDELLDFTSEEPARLSIVLVLYKQAPLSLLCLQSLLQHREVPLQLIIIDNASDDETPALLERIQGAEIIRNSENVGFVHAVNQGARLAHSDFILLLNNDAMVEAGSLSSALATINSATDIGAVGARIKLLNGKLQEAGSIIWSDGACLGYGRNQDPEAPEYLFQRDVDYCSGAFLLMRRDLFEELGGFDEAYAPAYYEESDFCIRLWENGYRVVYDPDAVIIHYEFASSDGFAGAAQLQAEHRELLCSKHKNYLSQRLANATDNILPGRHGPKRRNILMIDDRVPHPSLGAGYPRCAHMLNALADMGLNITLFPMIYPTDDWAQVYRTLPRTIEVMLDTGHVALEKFLRARAGYYDFIIVSREHNMKAFRHITDARPQLLSGAQIIYDAEAVIAPRENLRRRLQGDALSLDEEQQEIAEELALAENAHGIIAVSAREATQFQQAGHQHTHVLGHCLSPKPGMQSFAERKGLLFVGALRDDGSPNVDSLLWFVINVLPLIEAEIPDVTLTVVGDNTAASLAAIERSNINFTGRLDDLAGQYEASRVFVAPTRFAAGIPHKIHEAASHGIPSVATPLLAEQLAWQHEKEILVADDAKAWARQCIRLLGDEALWQSLREQGLQAIERDCSQANFEASLAKIFLAD